jgi:hypothetical protein
MVRAIAAPLDRSHVRMMMPATALRIFLSMALVATFCPPAMAQEAEEELPSTMQAPSPLPERAQSADTEELPATMDAPDPKPEETAGSDDADDPAQETADEPAEATDTPKQEEATHTPMPAEEIACRARLRELGVEFSEHEPLKEESGCSAPHPLTVTSLPGDVELRPQAVLTCAMAEATATFVRDHAIPMTRQEFGSDLTAIDQVSSYVCRPRNGTQTLSEHAFANALDWGALELADETRIEVRAYQRAEPRRARLISAIRDAACGPFKTVLGPGSDADHADHFHFDMAERRGGSTFCQ